MFLPRRVLHARRPAAGLGISFDLNTGDIANAVVGAIMPAVTAQMPNLVNAAWPAVQQQLPTLVGPMMDQAIPAIQARVPQMVNAALPVVYAQMPILAKKMTPLLEAQAKAISDAYVARYLGPAAQFVKYVPLLALASIGVSLFGSGIIIYNFWRGPDASLGEAAVPNRRRWHRRLRLNAPA